MPLALLLALGCGGEDDPLGDQPGGQVDAGMPDEPDASIEDVPDLASYINALTFPSVSGGVPSCCVDFGERSKDFIQNGTNEPDNALAELASSLSAFFDFQEIIDQSVENGDQVILLNHVGLSSDTDSFNLQGLLGNFNAGTTYAEASVGAGEFTIKPESYSPGTTNPLISLTGDMAAGAMSGGPTDFFLSIPLGEVSIDVTIKEAQLTGNATVATDGVSYSEGTIGGYVLIDEIFAALNAYGSTCTCLGLEGDLFSKVGDEWQGNCVDGASAACAGDSGCAAIGGDSLFDGEVCGLLPDLLQNNADIDTNNNATVYEGLSVGFEFTAVSASIVE